MKDLPCWLNSDDKEVAAALLELDWVWLEQEEPENWEEEIWERKICKCRGWQFWSVPGEVCLLISRHGAVFGLCLEAMNPKQLTLFLLGLCLLLCSCSQSEADKYFGNSRHDNCYEKPASDPCYTEPQPPTAHWCESSQNPAECFASQGAIAAPCTAKRDEEFQKCIDEIRKQDELRKSSKTH